MRRSDPGDRGEGWKNEKSGDDTMLSQMIIMNVVIRTEEIDPEKGTTFVNGALDDAFERRDGIPSDVGQVGLVHAWPVSQKRDEDG